MVSSRACPRGRSSFHFHSCPYHYGLLEFLAATEPPSPFAAVDLRISVRMALASFQLTDESSSAARLIAQLSCLHASEQYFLGVLRHPFSASGSIRFPQIGLQQISGMASASRQRLFLMGFAPDKRETIGYPRFRAYRPSAATIRTSFANS